MNGGKYIAQILRANGIRHLFTLCGGHISPIYVEAERAGIRIWDVRDEATAVFAADALARLTGIPGVVAVTAGPGVTNAITAIKNAQMAQSPVLILGGATATLLRKRGALQDIDQLSLLRSTVKFLARPKGVHQLATTVQRALQAARSGVPGPVFIECPVDLLYPEDTVRSWYGRENKPPKGLLGKAQQWYIQRHLKRLFATPRPAPDLQQPLPAPQIPKHSPADIRALDREISRAKQPLLIVSSGAMQLPDRVHQLASAIKKLNIPVYFSGMARGLTGRKNQVQYRHRRKQALRAADLILLAGVPCDFRLNYGRSLNRHARKITINRSRTDLRKNVRPVRAVHTDPGAFLIDLAAHARSEPPDWSDWRKTLQDHENSREEEIRRMAAETIDGINPLALFQRLEQLLPDHSVLIADGGDFAATASYTLRPRQPLGWLDPGVFGTLGVGGGFALGAAAHFSGDYIWIIYGDGSVAYSLAEFETFAKNGLKVCGIVGNNGSWEQIERDQVQLLGTTTAVRLPNTDYHRVATGYGAAGERVETLEAFEAAVSRAKASMDEGKPYLINAIIGSTTFRKGSISM